VLEARFSLFWPGAHHSFSHSALRRPPPMHTPSPAAGRELIKPELGIDPADPFTSTAPAAAGTSVGASGGAASACALRLTRAQIAQQWSSLTFAQRASDAARPRPRAGCAREAASADHRRLCRVQTPQAQVRPQVAVRLVRQARMRRPLPLLPGGRREDVRPPSPPPGCCIYAPDAHRARDCTPPPR
jgi:hypothetical protein